jgi:hypothetical protein
MTRSDDPTVITEADVDFRPTGWNFIDPVTDDELMTRDEWLDERRANACCERSNQHCPCGGPGSEPESRLLRGEPDEEF